MLIWICRKGIEAKKNYRISLKLQATRVAIQYRVSSKILFFYLADIKVIQSTILESLLLYFSLHYKYFDIHSQQRRKWNKKKTFMINVQVDLGMKFLCIYIRLHTALILTNKFMLRVNFFFHFFPAATHVNIHFFVPLPLGQ